MSGLVLVESKTRRDVLRLRAEGLSQSKIAAQIGVSKETVRNQLARAARAVPVPASPPSPPEGQRAESWLPVAGWESEYRVSDLGRVWSCPRLSRSGNPCGGRLLKQKVNGRTGRLEVRLPDGTRLVTRTVHTLVLEAFVGPRPDGQEGCHGKNGPLDNRWPENLYWATRSQNQGADKRRDGTYGRNRGERNGNSTLTADAVRHIRASMARDRRSVDRLAAIYDVVPNTIRDVAAGRSWAWLGDEVAP